MLHVHVCWYVFAGVLLGKYAGVLVCVQRGRWCVWLLAGWVLVWRCLAVTMLDSNGVGLLVAGLFMCLLCRGVGVLVRWADGLLMVR